MPRLLHHFRSIHLCYKRFECKICSTRFALRVNAKHHYAETHCKEVVEAFKKKGRLRLGDLPDTFWSEHNAIEDLGETDPRFPKDEYIKAILKAEEKAPEALQESSRIEKEELNAAVRSIQE